jgi:glycosyltransferase involved in cell wall biosynthesis
MTSHRDERDGAYQHSVDQQWYLTAYPDVQRAGLPAEAHYRRYGRWEGRYPYPLTAPGVEMDLWRGMAPEAVNKLKLLVESPDAGERIWAAWGLGRWFSTYFDWAMAERFLAKLCQEPLLDFFLPIAGPKLLPIISATAVGKISEANHRIRLAKKAVDASDLNLIKAYHSSLSDINQTRAFLTKALNQKVSFEAGESPLLDRLVSLPHRFHAVGRILAQTSDRPLVSILMPSYNAENTIQTSIRSILAQSWENIEVIVVDDASTDTTRAIVSNFVNLDPRVRLLSNNSRKGAYIARNRALSEATGAFYTVQDADDWAHPRKVEMQVKATVSHWARCTSNIQPYHWKLQEGYVHRNVSSLMLRMVARDQIGFWDRVKADADTEYYYRVMARYGPEAIMEVLPGRPLSLGRVHARSLTQSSQTHIRTQVLGARQSYQTAARLWHSSLAEFPERLKLSEQPARRPFSIPDVLSVGDEEAEQTDYQLVMNSELFDIIWYLRRNTDVRRSDVDPVEHYLNHGAAEGRNPSPFLNTTAYKAAYNVPQMNPIVHWESQPAIHRPSPLPVFRGRLAERRPNALVFGHAAEGQIFGAERSLVDVLDAMIRAGLIPSLVLPKVGSQKYLEKLLELSSSIHVCNMEWRHGQNSADPVIANMLRKIIANLKPDFVCVNTIVLDAPLIAARTAEIPSVVYIRELPEDDPTLCATLGMSAEEIRQSLLAKSDYFIANSELTAAWISSSERTTIIGNSVDPRLLEMEFSPARPLRFSLISSNIFKKGIRHAVALARALERQNASAIVQLIGPITRDVEQLMPLPQNLILLGYFDDPCDAIAQTDVLLSLSDFKESFGRTVLEAQAASRPVICFDNGYPKQIVEHGATGFVVPYADIETLSLSAMRLIESAELLDSFSAASRGRARILMDLNRNQSSELFVNIRKTLLNSKQR